MFPIVCAGARLLSRSDGCRRDVCGPRARVCLEGLRFSIGLRNGGDRRLGGFELVSPGEADGGAAHADQRHSRPMPGPATNPVTPR